MTTEHENNPVESAAEIERDLFAHLPELAAKLISPTEQNLGFRKDPDDVHEHSPEWHEFGIITHSEKVGEAYEDEAKRLLEQWQVTDSIDQVLSQKIDGRSKAELLQISIPLHDVGKFASDEIRGGIRIFVGHEDLGKKIILTDNNVQPLLKNHYLTEKQIQYIAECVGLHYQLGDLREQAKSQSAGYSIGWATGNRCQQACEEIANAHPEFKTEIGVWFLIDSLAKTDIHLTAQTDEEIASQSRLAADLIKTKNLNPELAAAAKQLPVNVAVAKTYLQTITR